MEIDKENSNVHSLQRPSKNGRGGPLSTKQGQQLRTVRKALGIVNRATTSGGVSKKLSFSGKTSPVDDDCLKEGKNLAGHSSVDKENSKAAASGKKHKLERHQRSAMKRVELKIPEIVITDENEDEWPEIEHAPMSPPSVEDEPFFSLPSPPEEVIQLWKANFSLHEPMYQNKMWPEDDINFEVEETAEVQEMLPVSVPLFDS